MSESELHVLLYVVRRTFGFHKNADAISVSQLASGITNADGEQLDYGTDMSKSAIWRGTKGLIEKGILEVDRIKNADGEYETNVYSLRFAEETPLFSFGEDPSSLREQPVSLQESRQNKAV